MKQKKWNHNFAYHKWILHHIKDKNKILDVGCGDGTLATLLASDNNEVIGLDIDDKILSIATRNNQNENIKYLNKDFLEYDFKNQKFDVIIFVASIHHMDMKNALIKAKRILNKNGIILIVGLAKPSSIIDWTVEIIRILPSKIISTFKQIKTSEDLNINVSYDFPMMREIRNVCNKELENYKIRYGLHYRYLLYWIKK